MQGIYINLQIFEKVFLIDVFHENTNKKITKGNIYRPPRNNNSNPRIDNYIIISSK